MCIGTTLPQDGSIIQKTCWHCSLFCHCSADDLNTLYHYHLIHDNVWFILKCVSLLLSSPLLSSPLLLKHLYKTWPFKQPHLAHFPPNIYTIEAFPQTQLISSHILDCRFLPSSGLSVPGWFWNVFRTFFLLNEPTPAPSRAFSIYLFGSGGLEYAFCP